MDNLIATLKTPLTAAQRLAVYRSHGIKGTLVRAYCDKWNTEERAYIVDDMRDVIRAMPSEHA